MTEVVAADVPYFNVVPRIHNYHEAQTSFQNSPKRFQKVATIYVMEFSTD